MELREREEKKTPSRRVDSILATSHHVNNKNIS